MKNDEIEGNSFEDLLYFGLLYLSECWKKGMIKAEFSKPGVLPDWRPEPEEWEN